MRKIIVKLKPIKFDGTEISKYKFHQHRKI